MTEWIAIAIDTLNLTYLTDNTTIAALVVSNAIECAIFIVATNRLVRWADAIIERSTEAACWVTPIALSAVCILSTCFHTLFKFKTGLAIGTCICCTWVALIPLNRLVAIWYTDTLLEPAMETIATLSIV